MIAIVAFLPATFAGFFNVFLQECTHSIRTSLNFLFYCSKVNLLLFEISGE